MVGQPLTRRVALGLLTAGGVAIAGLGGFVYAEGRIGSTRLTARHFIDFFEAQGKFIGYRRNHAKGQAVSGLFISNGAGVEVSSAVVFRKGTSRVSGRFSVGGPNPQQEDSPKSGRGLALQFLLPQGEQWRTAMVNIPVFPATNPEEFFEFTLASEPDPATGKPNEQRMKEFTESHPRTAEALKIIQSSPPSSSFATSRFNSIHAYIAVNSAGVKTPIRWELVPKSTVPESALSSQHNGKDWLFEDLVTTLNKEPVRYSLVLHLGKQGEDNTADPTQRWPETRRAIEVGTLELHHANRAEAERIRDVNFDPTVIPRGIELSDDPFPSARAAIYAESYKRRSQEKPATLQRFGERDF